MDDVIMLVTTSQHNENADAPQPANFVECPKRIRLMCRLIDELLVENENATQVFLEIPLASLQFIV